MLHSVKLLTVRFPEVKLPTRAAHHLRGYFGNLFKTHSPLLHNHFEDGTYRYAYPVIQYKVVRGVPELLGIGEGADLLRQLFIKVKEIDIEGRVYPVRDKEITYRTELAGVGQELLTYRFDTLWMALNQENYRKYLAADRAAKAKLLNRLLQGQLLFVFKGMGIWLEKHERIMAQTRLEERSANFKNQRMRAFGGEFTTNAVLPDGLGVGKSVSRGFGSFSRATSPLLYPYR